MAQALRHRDPALTRAAAVNGTAPPEAEAVAFAARDAGALVAAASAGLVVPLGFAYLSDDVVIRLGVGPLAIAFLAVVSPLAAAAAALPVARIGGNRRRRRVAALSAVLVSIGLVGAAVAPGQLVLAGALALAGVGAAALPALHRPGLMMLTDPGARARALAAHRAVEMAGGALAVEIAAVAMAAAHTTWRAAFLLLGTTAMLGAIGAARTPDGRPGATDTGVPAAEIEPQPIHGATEPDLRVGEAVRQVLQVPSFSAFLSVNVVMGLLLLAVPLSLLHWFDERWHVSPAGQGDLLAIVLLAAAAGACGGQWHTSRVGGRPEDGADATIGRLSVLMIGSGAACVVATVSPGLPMTVGAIATAYAALGAAAPAIDCLALSVVEPARRAEAGALLGIATALGMALGGVLLLASIDSRFGPGGAVLAAGLGVTLSGLGLRRAGPAAGADIDRLVDLLEDRVHTRMLAHSGRPVPLLSCRAVDFSYGQLQVLFDVDFSVDEGEMVALLGTNGAGKSTLLRAISGLSLVNKGTIRFQGRDITHLDAERRMRLGITQIPGGKGIYGPLSVVENLRTFGYTLARDRRQIAQGIDAALEAFPRLGERRNQPASTMSGGEQQMLNLARAYVVRPRLLLIDELSLGLAPLVVAELLKSVRDINRSGVAVVIVEQSVNIALSLVDHAYFMEKGEMRFDGPAHDLLDRRDLLRSVFLEGATTGTRS